MNFNGLTNINIELTNKCNKNCWICGRRRIEKEKPGLFKEYTKSISFDLLKIIARQVPEGIVIQLHNNGEPLLYDRFGDALDLFKNNITNIVTNGKLLLEKKEEIIGKLDTLSISVFENDNEADEQFEIISRFLEIKGNQKPFTSLRLIGDVDQEKYKPLNTMIISRILHSPYGSFDYKKRKPTIPEIGICLDFLNHLAIDTEGNVSVCVRFDPDKKGVIGNIQQESLLKIWSSKTRLKWKGLHISGKRNLIPLCSKCEFWGIPTGF
jgi:radical SAM protein with 4Fe4S-binding SPASM domain